MIDDCGGVPELKLMQKNVQDEAMKLQRKLTDIMGLDSLTSVGKYVNTPGNLLKLFQEEIRFMCREMIEEVQRFENKMVGLLKQSCKDRFKSCDVRDNTALDDEAEIIQGFSKQLVDLPKNETSIAVKKEMTLLSLNDVMNSTMTPGETNELELFSGDYSFSDGLRLSTCSTDDDDDDEEFGRIKIIPKYKCRDCPKVFWKSMEFRKHCREIHDKYGVSCPVCGRKFISNSAMEEHHRTHTGERPFTCTTCGKCFARQTSFRVHKKIHLNLKPFICDVCGKAFRSKQHVDGHKMMHSRVRNFICAICGKAFIWNQNLYQHMKTHGPKQGGKRRRQTNKKVDSI